ncbi:3-hydroxyacyl-CoA dehydrogenase [Roseiarcus fermentans]|uniref:3-hydroxyacyl-CoA dehydrogenase n=1 Tax=Roseiarcus fermentans TaxID=1473586 RepID=A0A366FBJ7_9HYPH|nr:3-hydroxyacyl-CoA dehydrogenase NAD-binding domain-containing protein [Roseiarcus fermentans]RBP12011.1 3-hydroxyacyl-CoA dehydrogenase [Roseiarcus fermentans]
MTTIAGVARVTVLGAGTIGASWCALFLAKGLDVVAYDVGPDCERALLAFVEAAWPLLGELGFAPDASISRLRYRSDLSAACAGTDFVQECAPERADLKVALLETVDGLIRPDVLIASSSSALTVSEMQTRCRHPERVVLGHPFNPPHIMPLVEVAGGAKTAPEALDRATRFYEALGKSPIRLNKEVYGHVANRIQAAVFREAIHLLASGVASLVDIDKAITDGPGLRWALMGPFLTYHLGGGVGGMAAFMQQFAPVQQKLWAELGSPALDETLQAEVIEAMRREAGGRAMADLVHRRDESLVALLKSRSDAAAERDD